MMTPGQHHRYNQLTGNVSSEYGDIKKYISWKEGKLIFKDESIVTIAHKLGRWYNVDSNSKTVNPWTLPIPPLLLTKIFTRFSIC